MPTFEFDQATLAYTEAGAGETAVLLHSSASSGAQWRGLCAPLAERFAVLAPISTAMARAIRGQAGRR